MFVVAAELMGASQGIGYLLLEGENNGQPALILAAMLIFALAGKATDLVLVAIARRALRWKIPSATDDRTCCARQVV